MFFDSLPSYLIHTILLMGSRAHTSVSGTGHLEIGSRVISFQPNVKDFRVVLDWSQSVLPRLTTSLPSVVQLT